MAKKKDLKTDDFDFGEDLDFPDFNFDGPDVKDDRNPATKIKDGAIAGAKETIKSPAFIANMVRKALPTGYGSIMDLTDQGADSIKSIYSDTVKEIKPVIKDIKRTVKKIMPSAESILPKAMADKIKTWADSDPESNYRGESAENQRDAALQMQLGDIFKFQTISELKNKSESDAKDSIREGIDFTRHKDSLGQLDAMRVSLQQLAGYQSKIESNFQKKSLELQFRHYFVAVDSLQEQKRQNAVVTTSMEGILKNTGLPEFAKLHQYERLKEVLRNKFIEGAADTIFNKRRNFLRNVTKSVATTVKDRVSRFAGGIRDGLGGVEMAADVAQQQAEMGGPGAAETGGNFAGGIVANMAGNRVGKYLYDKVGSKNKGILKVGNQLQYTAENYPQMLTDFARSQKGETGTFLDTFLNIGKQAILSASTGMDTELTTDKAGSMQNPDIFGRQTNKSITEIIPGYLSRIYQELQIIRTGNTKTEMTTYDFETNKFNSESGVKKNIFKSLVSDSSKKITKEEIANLIKLIDPDGTKLNPEQNKIFGDQLLNDNLRNASGDASRLKTTSAYTGKAEPYADYFAEMMQNYFADDELKEKNLQFSRAYNRLGSNISDQRKSIQSYSNNGNRRHLEELGLIKDKTNNIDMERFQNYHNEDGDPLPNILDDTIPDIVPRRLTPRQRRQQPVPIPRLNPRRTRNGPLRNDPVPSPIPNEGPNENFFTLLNTQVVNTIKEINSNPILESIRDILSSIKEKIKGTPIPEEIIIEEEERNPLPFNRKVKNKRSSGPNRKKTAADLRAERKQVNNPQPILPPDPINTTSTVNSYKEIVDAIKNNSSKTISQVMSETLLRIEKKINDGVNLNSKRRGSSQPGENGPKRPWYDMSIGNILGGVTGAVGSGISKIAGLSQSILGNAGSIAQSGWKFGKGLFDKGSKKVSTLGDIYVGDEKDPRLLAWKIKAGHYKDKLTGKVIKSLKDITGEVVDELNNTVIGTKEDIEKAYTKIGNAKSQFISKLGATWKVIKDTSEKISNSALKGMGFFYEQAFNLGKKAYGLLDLPQDIYVEGKPDPVMLARTMKAGGYISRITKAPVLVPSAIDGVILNDVGDIVLTAEEFAKGILDKHGKPIKTGVAKLMDIGKRLLTNGIDKLMTVGKMATDATIKGVKFAGKTISNIGQGIGDTMVNGIGSWGMFDRANAKRNNVGNLNEGVGGDSKGIIEKLNEIYALLKERLAIPKAKILGDADGDGDRDGSYKDLMSRKEKKEEKKEELKPADPRYRGGKSLMATMGGGIKGLYDKIRGKNEDGEGDGSDIDINGDRDNRRSRRMQRRRSGPAPAGAWNKVKHYGSKAARGVGTAARWGGKAALGIAGLGGLGLGGIASAATSGIGAALGGVGSLAAGAGSMLMAGGGALLTGIGAMLASPVILGALAVAAVGAAGYFAYKAYTKKKLADLSKIRYAQYGFLPTDATHLETIFGLEDMLMPGVSYDKGMAKIDDKKVDLRKMMDSFSINQGDDGGVKLWTTWFIERFKPVFLTHLTALKAISPKTDLSGVDDMAPDEKLKYLNAIKFPEGPYNVFASPFPDISSLSAGGSNINGLIEIAAAAITKEMKGAKDKPKTTAVASTMVAGAVTAAGTINVGGAASTSAPGTVAAVNKLTEKNIGVSGIAPIGNIVTVMGVPIGMNKFASGKIDELTTIRFKTYGLLTMAIEKLKSLDALEEIVNKNLTFGKNNVASWKGSVEEALDSVKALFEINTVDGREGQSWQGWFTMRFLPTYMTYLSALCSTTNKQDPRTAAAAITPQQMFEVAMATQAAKNSTGGSVWTITDTPWWGFDLNTSINTTDENMQSLKNKSKSTVLNELSAAVPDISKDAKKQNSVAAADGSTNNTSRLPEVKVPSFWSKASTAVSDAAKYVASGVSNAASMVGGAVSSAASYVKDKASSLLSGGTEVTHPGNGTGGDVNSVAAPTGNKSWSALKDTILSAAKMAGVDPKLMATMAAIESGFNHAVQAGTSSATGLYQFISSTWKTMIKKYGPKYGISPDAKPTDPKANALMGAEFIKENTAALKGVTNRPLTDTDLYLAHFLGAGGAKKFLKADPNAIAADIMPAPAKANQGIFYKNGRPLTIGEVYSLINERVRSKGKQFGIEVTSTDVAAVASKTPSAVTGGTASTKPSAGLVGGVVATAGAAATAANKTTTPTGLIPVADQTPGISSSPANTPAAQASVKPLANTTGQKENIDPNVVAAGGGFVNPRSRDLNSQMQYQKDMNAELLGNVNTTLQTSNGIQQSQLDVLNSILKLMGIKPTGVIKDTKEAVVTPPNVSRNTVSSPPRAMSTPPVSMAKPVY